MSQLSQLAAYIPVDSRAPEPPTAGAQTAMVSSGTARRRVARRRSPSPEDRPSAPLPRAASTPAVSPAPERSTVGAITPPASSATARRQAVQRPLPSPEG